MFWFRPTKEFADTSSSSATSVGSSAFFVGSKTLASAACSAMTTYTIGRSDRACTNSSGMRASACKQRHEHQRAAAVPPIGDPADERCQQHGRDQLDQKRGRGAERRPGELVDDDRQARQQQPVAGVRDQAGEPEPAEVRRTERGHDADSRSGVGTACRPTCTRPAPSGASSRVAERYGRINASICVPSAISSSGLSAQRVRRVRVRRPPLRRHFVTSGHEVTDDLLVALQRHGQQPAGLGRERLIRIGQVGVISGDQRAPWPLPAVVRLHRVDQAGPGQRTEVVAAVGRRVPDGPGAHRRGRRTTRHQVVDELRGAPDGRARPAPPAR